MTLKGNWCLNSKLAIKIMKIITVYCINKTEPSLKPIQFFDLHTDIGSIKANYAMAYYNGSAYLISL